MPPVQRARRRSQTASYTSTPAMASSTPSRRRTGTRLWSATTDPNRDNGVTSSPAVANGVVFVGSWDYKLFAFDARSGSTLWSATTGFLVDSSPAVAHG